MGALMRASRRIVLAGLFFAVITFTGIAPAQQEAKEDSALMSAETFAGLELRGLGPAFMSGRIADIAVHPEDRSRWYAAAGSGGIFETTNAGTTWEPVFEDQGSYSIGCVTIDQKHPHVVWVGTGENVGGRHVGYGDGVYRSRDGGASWEKVGLERTEHIARILIDPRDSGVVYVAAQGPLWSGGGQRGLYKTTDGGESWEKVLGKGDHVGVTDVVMHPEDPDILFAATHQRMRTVGAVINGGPGSGIHKSLDGGETWRELRKGLPEQDMGQIGLAISPQNPDVVYATIELAIRDGGFWRSEDAGESWEKRSDVVAGGTGPHYYQELFASPHEFDRVYMMDVRLKVTEDGGRTWESLETSPKHVDNHALAFDPDDPDYLLVGTDGGVYETWDHGESWRHVRNLPLTQFYKIAVDYDEPFYNVYGGTQDNATQGGPSRTDSVSGILSSDWFVTVFADGYQPRVDPTNVDIVYSEWQNGNLIRHDRKTGEIVHIQPQPEPGEPAERWNWDAPIIISPHDPARLYFASQRVWRSDDRGDSWTPISEDLTRDVSRLHEPIMGRQWSDLGVWDLVAMSDFSTLSALSESPLVEGLIYAGSDDGVIAVTEDGGQSWRRVLLEELPDAPEAAFVNDVLADRHDPDRVYAVLDNHKEGDFAPYLYRSEDRGRSWTSIRGDLPDRHVLWSLVQDHENPELLFVGTEFGIFFTIDGGERWIQLSGGVPTIPFRDLEIQRRENDLVGGSFGRGFYVLDDYTPLREVSEERLSEPAVLFDVRDAWWYIPREPLGYGEKGSQGDAFFTAPNPPFGAVFTYYLRDELKTERERRHEREKKIAEEGEDTPFPGWDRLKQEEREPEPEVLLVVEDAKGNVVRRVKGDHSAGFHRVAWDLRYPPIEPVKSPEPEGEASWREPRGILAPPGTYRASLVQKVMGEVTRLAGPVAFEVRPLRDGTLEGASPRQAFAFQKELAELARSIEGARAAIDGAKERLETIEAALARSTVAPDGLDARVRALRVKLADLEESLEGDPRPRRIGEPTPPSIVGRVALIERGTRRSTYGPTQTHRESLRAAEEGFAALQPKLEALFETDLPALEQQLEAAGVPWTPGRPIPSFAGPAGRPQAHDRDAP
jgi:photosystem II stability/assembly factor-like uncharacterized protein